MSAQVIKFASRRRHGEAAKPTATCEGAFPVAQGAKRARPPRRLGHPKARKALTELHAQAGSFESCMQWLKQLSEEDPDPRAIAALIDEWPEWAVFKSFRDVDAMLAFVGYVLTERRKYLPLELV